MTDYYQKYFKYKTKYLELKNKTNKMHNLIGGSKKPLIIHISGTQGSGKSTLGNKLIKKYKSKINVFDLDNLLADYNQTNKDITYQSYLDEIIKKYKNKPILFVGLNAELCLGLMEDSDIVYELNADYKFYIETSLTTLKQRFFRQIDKLQNRKEWFFEEWNKNPETIQNKLFRFVDLNKWNENNEKCDKLFVSKNYIFMDSEEIFNEVCELLDKNFKL
jgi:adenylate kinase family enzyme